MDSITMRELKQKYDALIDAKDHVEYAFKQQWIRKPEHQQLGRKYLSELEEACNHMKEICTLAKERQNWGSFIFSWHLSKEQWKFLDTVKSLAATIRAWPERTLYAEIDEETKEFNERFKGLMCNLD